jgi:hypothetical protein
VRFLLVFVVACGSSSAAVSASAPLEAETEERDLASAPVAVQEEEDCYCPEVTVRCGKGEGFHARADRATCTLDLPPHACELFGFETGAKARPEAIRDFPAPEAPSAEDVYELCSTKHEAHHACDRRMDRRCQFEVDAYDVSLECMGSFAADPRVAFQMEAVRAAREMNACLCAESSCGACSARCKSDHPGLEATCAQAEIYCR